MGFPSSLSVIELSPFFVRDGARSDGGDVWETEDADPYWTGRGTTGKLNADLLQNWEGFIQEAVRTRAPIDFVDPVYYIPAAYRAAGLPGGFSGTGILVNLSDAAAPVVSGLPIGLVLKRGDRLSLSNGSNISCHMLSANLVVSSATAQAVPITPAGLPNVFAPASNVVLLNPVIRLNIVANSWSAPRRARQDTIGTFAVEEASIL